MNEALETFRKRLRGPEKEKFKFTRQFWIGSPTAWLALLISSATAFSSIVYYSDELGVQVPSPQAFKNESKDQIHVVLPPGITFVNSGSRPIAVLKVSIRFIQPRRKAEHIDCLHGQMDVAWLPLHMLVVKPYDIMAYELKYNDWMLPRDLHFASSELNKENSSPMVVFVSCAIFQIVAADTTSFFTTVEIARTDEYGFDRSRLSNTQHLIKRSTFWTSVAGKKDIEISDDLVQATIRQETRDEKMQETREEKMQHLEVD
jgi:hypothetical protein